MSEKGWVGLIGDGAGEGKEHLPHGRLRGGRGEVEQERDKNEA